MVHDRWWQALTRNSKQIITFTWHKRNRQVDLWENWTLKDKKKAISKAKYSDWVLNFEMSFTVIPPTSIRFPIGGKRVTCRGSKLTNSLGKQQYELPTRTWSGHALWNLANLWASRRKENDCSSQFFLVLIGRYNKTLNDAPRETVIFVSPRPQCFPRLRLGEHWGSRGNKTHCFPCGQP